MGDIRIKIRAEELWCWLGSQGESPEISPSGRKIFMETPFPTRELQSLKYGINRAPIIFLI